jgi:hypothetical protein
MFPVEIPERYKDEIGYDEYIVMIFELLVTNLHIRAYYKFELIQFKHAIKILKKFKTLFKFVLTQAKELKYFVADMITSNSSIGVSPINRKKRLESVINNKGVLQLHKLALPHDYDVRLYTKIFNLPLKKIKQQAEKNKKVGFKNNAKVGPYVNKKVGFKNNERVGFKNNEKVGFKNNERVGFKNNAKVGPYVNKRVGFKNNAKVDRI